MHYEENETSDKIVQGVFDLKYLVQFSKCANLDKNIRIHFKNDYPIIIQCNVASLGMIRLCLAPKTTEK